MRKIGLLLLLTVMITVGMNAQNVFDKGSLMFNAGIGVPDSYGAIPTINFSGEMGVIPTGDIGVVSFGALAEFQLGRHEWYTGYYDTDNEYFPRFYIGPRAAWHFTGLNTDIFDVYGGVGFGFVIEGKTDHYDSNFTIDPDVFVGGRWMFSPGAGLFAEVGATGLSAIRAGLTFGL